MRCLLVAALLAGVAAVTAAPASATCMESFDKFGVSTGTCSAPGGPPSSYVCYRDHCHWL